MWGWQSPARSPTLVRCSMIEGPLITDAEDIQVSLIQLSTSQSQIVSMNSKQKLTIKTVHEHVYHCGPSYREFSFPTADTAFFSTFLTAEKCTKKAKHNTDLKEAGKTDSTRDKTLDAGLSKDMIWALSWKIVYCQKAVIKLHVLFYGRNMTSLR